MELDTLRAMINRQLEDVEHWILTGSFTDIVSYKEQVAARHAYRMVLEMMDKISTAEEEDEA